MSQPQTAYKSQGLVDTLQEPNTITVSQFYQHLGIEINPIEEKEVVKSLRLKTKEDFQNLKVPEGLVEKVQKEINRLRREAYNEYANEWNRLNKNEDVYLDFERNRIGRWLERRYKAIACRTPTQLLLAYLTR